MYGKLHNCYSLKSDSNDDDYYYQNKNESLSIHVERKVNSIGTSALAENESEQKKNIFCFL